MACPTRSYLGTVFRVPRTTVHLVREVREIAAIEVPDSISTIVENEPSRLQHEVLSTHLSVSHH